MKRNQNRIFSTRRLVIMSALIALQIVLARFLSIQASDTLRISFETVPIALAGMWLGPVSGIIVALVSDLLGTIIHGYGVWFPPIALGPMLFAAMCGWGVKYFFKNSSHRRIGRSLILSIVTLGAYQIYWKYLLVKNVRALRKDDSKCAGEMLCLIFVPFYSLYWWITRGKIVKDSFAERGYSAVGNEMIYLLLGIFQLEIVSLAVMQHDFNTLPEAALHAERSESLSDPKDAWKVIVIVAFAGIINAFPVGIATTTLYQMIIVGKEGSFGVLAVANLISRLASKPVVIAAVAALVAMIHRAVYRPVISRIIRTNKK